ncbi:MAG: hypothetical protein K8R60_08265 [Burkholderiales bacterium]|nr:hypothetical protein [Burkholderiales bacterium]
MSLPKLLQLLVVGAMAVPVAAAAQARTACQLLSAADAASLMGAPLPEPFKSEMRPEKENGHDHKTACGWFPKGVKLATADAPPERGILLTLHRLRTPHEAATFHEHSTGMMRDAAQSNPALGKSAPAPGIGEEAELTQKELGGVRIATLRFLKGTVAGQVQVWRKDGPAGDVATAAAKRVVAKL